MHNSSSSPSPSPNARHCHHGSHRDSTRNSPPPGHSHSRGHQNTSSPAQSSSPADNSREAELIDLRRQILALTNAKKPSEDGKKRKRVPKGDDPTPLQQGRAIPRR
ncbi:hypothetical protein C8R42DRAFT_727181 [Lentinula raphanica]|nr:hypothetical protein C8R42DRAFT_727181 [Lentinula raphanica]